MNEVQVVADAGAGSTPEDYTLAPEDRVFPWHLDSVAERILQLLADADAASANNARLLPAIHTEKTDRKSTRLNSSH